LSAKCIQKKGDVWYFRRRVRAGCEGLHRDTKGKPKAVLFFSLKTPNQAEAARKADEHVRRQDALWANHLSGATEAVDPKAALGRLEAAGLKPGDAIRYPGHPRIDEFIETLRGGPRECWEDQPEPSAQDKLTIDLLRGKQIPRTLSDAKEKHLAVGKGPRNKTAQQQFDRAWNLLMSITAETVSKYVYQIKPVLDTAIREFELGIPNPFEGLSIPGKGEAKPNQRFPYRPEELKAIQNLCKETDDQRRWAIAMLSDTGARQAEVVGLRKDEVMLSGDIPHIIVRPNQNRGLKTKQSERGVPLVGEAQWAAQRAMTTEGENLFPVFQPKQVGRAFNANTASAALNKWVKEKHLAKKGQGLHSFRRTLVDRLRDAGVPKDIRDQIGGWASQGVSEGYGQGFSLAKLQEAMLRITKVKAQEQSAERAPAPFIRKRRQGQNKARIIC